MTDETGRPRRDTSEQPDAAARRRPRTTTMAIAGGAIAVILMGGALVVHSDRKTNRVPLAASTQPVSVVRVESAPYRARRSYVGTLEPWVEADVGPQYVSAYVDTVLVRPGARVGRGQVIATLDCSNPTAETRAVAMRARAVSEQQRALADQAARTSGLLDGGFVAANEVEVKTAQSTAEKALLLESQARLAASSLQVRDCVLRAPFDGEIASRSIDPGAFVRPGTAIVSVVDRSTIRVTADVPEKDFAVIPPSTPVEIQVLSTGQRLSATVSRRAPKADPRTRTVHIEIDVPDPERQLPVGTTGVVSVDVGRPVQGTKIPRYAATLHGDKAKLFVVEGGRAHAREVPVFGESGGDLYVNPAGLPAGAAVVTEGRALLSDGDPVRATPERVGIGPDASAPPARGGGFGRPL